MSSNHGKDYSQVTEFFFRPDIVYTCPGMKDSMCVWTSGKKQILQKHYLTMFLREAFHIFKEECPNLQIGFSKFCSLRPKNVLLLKSTPSEQCKCKNHENFILKLKSLQYHYSDDFWKSHFYDSTLNSDCWKNKCSTCSGGSELLAPSESEKAIVWKEWKR